MTKRSRTSILGGGIAGLLAVAALWLNPFQGLSKYVSEEFYMRAIAAAYPVGRPHTLLVLADDRTLASASRGEIDRDWARWPLPLTAWSAALEQAQARSAKMVLLDIGLIDRRDPDAERELLATLRLTAATVDVFIVDPGPQPTGQTLASWLVANAQSKRVRLVSPERAPAKGFSTTYLLTPQRLKTPVAAVAMADTYCRGVARCASGKPRADRIELWWPMPGCAGSGASGDRCRPGLSAALRRAASLTVAQAFSGVCENLPKLLSCSALPPTTLSGYAVDSMSLEDFTRKREIAANAPPPDAIVVSQNFDLAQDLVTSPVYGETPGAHAHAVAFDNLVTLGGAAITRAYPLGMSENAFLTSWIVAALSMVLVTRIYARVVLGRGSLGLLKVRVGRFNINLDALLPAIIIPVMLVALLLFCFLKSVSPANWLAACAALGIVWTGESRIEKHVRFFLLRQTKRGSGARARRLALFIAKRR